VFRERKLKLLTKLLGCNTPTFHRQASAPKNQKKKKTNFERSSFFSFSLNTLERRRRGLDVVNVVAVIAAAVVAVDVVELDVVVHVAAHKVHRLVDLDRLGELAVRLQIPRLVS